MRVEEIQASPANGLSIIAGAAAGQWLRYLIAVDAGTPSYFSTSFSFCTFLVFYFILTNNV